MTEYSLNHYEDPMDQGSVTDFSVGDFNLFGMKKNGRVNADKTPNQRFSSSLTKEVNDFTDPMFNPFLSKSTPCISRHMSTTSLETVISNDDRDYTRVKPTVTSVLRYKIARNEPINSYYYTEHVERFGKPPFIMGARATKLSTDLFLLKKT